MDIQEVARRQNVGCRSGDPREGIIVTEFELKTTADAVITELVDRPQATLALQTECREQCFVTFYKKTSKARVFIVDSGASILLMSKSDSTPEDKKRLENQRTLRYSDCKMVRLIRQKKQLFWGVRAREGKGAHGYVALPLMLLTRCECHFVKAQTGAESDGRNVSAEVSTTT